MADKKKDKTKKDDPIAKGIGTVLRIAFPGSILFDSSLRKELTGSKKKDSKEGKKKK